MNINIIIIITSQHVALEFCNRLSLNENTFNTTSDSCCLMYVLCSVHCAVCTVRVGPCAFSSVAAAYALHCFLASCNHRHIFLTPDEGDAKQSVLEDGKQEPHGSKGAVVFGQRAETTEQAGTDDTTHQGRDAAVPETKDQKQALRD